MLVWSQLVVAGYACPQLSPQNDFASMPHEAMPGAMPMDCGGNLDPDQPTLCKAHCEQSSQSSQSNAPDLPPLNLTTVIWLALLPDQLNLRPTQAFDTSPARLTGAAPPLRIQYQVFRN